MVQHLPELALAHTIAVEQQRGRLGLCSQGGRGGGGKVEGRGDRGGLQLLLSPPLFGSLLAPQSLLAHLVVLAVVVDE